jgi:uroporphyrinogen-III decarboxylase
MTETTSARDRWVAALRMQAPDHLPFWPKLDASYSAHQRGRWHEGPLHAIHEWIGSDLHHYVPSCMRVVRRSVSVETEQFEGVRRCTYRTPAGVLTGMDRLDAASQSWHPVDFPVKAAGDLEAMRLVFEDQRAEFDAGQHEKALKLARENSGRNLLVATLGVSPLMDWVQHLAGVEAAHYLLADHREAVEALFEALHACLCAAAEIIADHSPADAVYCVENTSTTLISPDMFRRYSMRYLRDYGERLASGGKMQILHQCGHLKALLPDMAELPAAAMEAYTTPPVGNATLADGRSACPRLCLIGGTNAALWLRPAEDIIGELEVGLAALPHLKGLIISSAGVMPPAATPEKIKAVADWVKARPVA